LKIEDNDCQYKEMKDKRINNIVSQEHRHLQLPQKDGVDGTAIGGAFGAQRGGLAPVS
jgi:hypothetical protein